MYCKTLVARKYNEIVARNEYDERSYEFVYK